LIGLTKKMFLDLSDGARIFQAARYLHAAADTGNRLAPERHRLV
jgi:hypothetical protein